jgi:hypothetical protein
VQLDLYLEYDFVEDLLERPVVDGGEIFRFHGYPAGR